MSEHETTPMPFADAGQPELPSMPRLVVLFGGTFDPPHLGHVELPVKVRDELERRGECVGQGWLVYFPAARSPHKERGPVVSDADRVEMLRLGIAGVPRAAVWTEEIDRAHGADEPSYTVETVRRARAWLDENGMAEVPLRLLIGADQAVGFHRWKEPLSIARMANPAVMVRGEVADSEDLVSRLKQNRFWRREDLEAWRAGMVEVGRMDVSATRVRDALRSGDAAEVERWLAPGVAAYIRERGLYQQDTVL